MNLLPYFLRKIKDNALFQGKGISENYFEGWYIKLVSADKSSVYAVIPGVAYGKKGSERHAFIQLIDGKTAETEYFSFPIESFSYSTRKFEVNIGDNYFSSEKIRLAIPGKLMGEVNFHQPTPYPFSWREPGIMNRYRYAPFMECYHGVVSLDHPLSGWLEVGEQRILLGEGRGYTEKDWGRSFPSTWIWMQGNHFSQPGRSFMLSVANIPWVGQSFTGFLGFFLHEGKLVRFGTYSGAKLSEVVHHEKGVHLKVTGKDFELEVEALRDQAGILKAPVGGIMERRISESIDAKIVITLRDRSGNLLVQDTTEPAGFELVGDVDALIQKIK